MNSKLNFVIFLTLFSLLTSCSLFKTTDSDTIDREVFPGMTMRDVESRWGEPAQIDYAGQTRSNNQRWIYSEGLSTRQGVAKQKVIYFERGRVVGWETEDITRPSRR